MELDLEGSVSGEGQGAGDEAGGSDHEGSVNGAEPEAEVQVENKDEFLRKIPMVRANLGHPSQEVLLRTLRIAKVSCEIAELAKNFQCPHCRERGR